VGGAGKLVKAKVVFTDSSTDIAVLYVPGLDAVPLGIGSTQPTGTSLVVTGFPGGGRLALISARVRGSMPSQGTDIYGKAPVRRTIYSIRADIQHGDSGAPLINADGEVVGVVFASSATDGQTGYALLPSAVTTALKAAGKQTQAADTGICVTQ
jgi:S1-C subfamily serine protease